jgi:outer membrane immunogenic protein
MKRILLAGACAIFTVGANAADLPVRAAAPAPVAMPVFTWTGFYVGLNAGYSWGSDRVSVLTVPGTNFFGNAALRDLAATEGTVAGSPDGSGFAGGGQIGFNYQTGALVLGVEADIQWLNREARLAVVSSTTGGGVIPAPIDTALTATSAVDWLGTLRARLGFTVTPTLLLYGTGGLAFGSAKSTFAMAQSHNGFGGLVTGATAASYSETRVGYALGVGGEWAFARNWSAKVEYMYFDLGSARYDGGVLLASTPAPAPRYSVQSTVRADFSGSIVRAGVNYKF